MQSANDKLCSEVLIADGDRDLFHSTPSIIPTVYWQGVQVGAAIQQICLCNAAQTRRDREWKSLLQDLGTEQKQSSPHHIPARSLYCLALGLCAPLVLLVLEEGHPLSHQLPDALH